MTDTYHKDGDHGGVADLDAALEQEAHDEDSVVHSAAHPSCETIVFASSDQSQKERSYEHEAEEEYRDDEQRP